MNHPLKKPLFSLIFLSLIPVSVADEIDHMYLESEKKPPVLMGDHHLVFQGEKDISGYNNHVYLAHHENRFWAIWSSSPRDGGHTGQHIRFATSANGINWSQKGTLAHAPPNKYLIARGLWVRDGELLALVARCSGQALTTSIDALEAHRFDPQTSTWQPAGLIGEEIINNYAPIRLQSGAWLMPYRYRDLNRVDGVLIGGEKTLDSWEKILFPGDEQDRFTEANAIIRKDESIAVHFRDNLSSGFLFRSVSKDGGRSFAQPKMTDFPDIKCKHLCIKLSNGMYVLINNTHSRATLNISGSDDGMTFSQTAILRNNPPKLRNPGHDKSLSFTYPHAIEYEGFLYIAYSVNRDDIYLTRISSNDIARQIGKQEPSKRND